MWLWFLTGCRNVHKAAEQERNERIAAAKMRALAQAKAKAALELGQMDPAMLKEHIARVTAGMADDAAGGSSAVIRDLQARPALKAKPGDFERLNPIAPNDRVTRGTDWAVQAKHDAASLPSSHLGTVISGAGPHAWKVRWDCGGVSSHVYGHGVYTLAVLKAVLGMPSVRVAEVLPSIEWTRKPSVAFAEQVAALDRPAVLHNTAASSWAAMEAWTDEGLLGRVTEPLAGVKVKGRGRAGHAFNYYHHAAMNTVPSMVDAYKATTFTKHNMTFAQYMRRTRQQRSDREAAHCIANGAEPECNGGKDGEAGEAAGKAAYTSQAKVGDTENTEGDSGAPKHEPGMEYSWAGKLDDWGLEMVADVVPLDPFMVLSPGFDPSNEHLFRQTFVWLSPTGSVTPTHYDVSHNFFIQLRGKKRVLLYPPEAWQQLYLYPVLHPGALATQVDIANITSGTFRNYNADHVFAIQADLEAGDVRRLCLTP